jgi:hypothetical protein
VDVEPQAVTRAVPERLSQSMPDENLPRGPIHIGRRRPRFDGIDRRRLRLQNRGMESAGLR